MLHEFLSVWRSPNHGTVKRMLSAENMTTISSKLHGYWWVIVVTTLSWLPQRLSCLCQRQDNLWCSQWQQNCHHDNTVTITTFPFLLLYTSHNGNIIPLNDNTITLYRYPCVSDIRNVPLKFLCKLIQQRAPRVRIRVRYYGVPNTTPWRKGSQAGSTLGIYSYPQHWPVSMLSHTQCVTGYKT